MASFNADPNIAGNMFALFAFANGLATIGNFNVVSAGTNVDVQTAADLTTYLKYLGTGLADNGSAPTAGTFTSVEIFLNNVASGKLDNISPQGNFVSIDDANAYHILDGNDDLHGAANGAFNDVLFGGFGGTDQYFGLGGNDILVVAANQFALAHLDRRRQRDRHARRGQEQLHGRHDA